MEYRELGTTGIEVSLLGFGCGGVGGLFVKGDPASQRAAVTQAILGGITYFDTAASYGDGLSEQNLGRVLRELQLDPVVGTKVTVRADEVGSAAPLLRARLQEGLKRLGRERVDVCTFHGRIGQGFEHNVTDIVGPIAAAMRSLVEAGLCRAIGFSGMGDGESVISVIDAEVFDYFQCMYSLSNSSAAYQRGAIPVEKDYGGVLAKVRETKIGVMAISILAGGILSGDPPHPNSWAERPVPPDANRHATMPGLVRPIVGEFGLATPSEVAIAFALSNSDMSTVLVGFSDEDQVESGLRAAARAPLAPPLLERLHELIEEMSH